VIVDVKSDGPAKYIFGASETNRPRTTLKSLQCHLSERVQKPYDRFRRLRAECGVDQVFDTWMEKVSSGVGLLRKA